MSQTRRIAIDAHFLEGARTGVGRYLENILRGWCHVSDVEFILYFKDGIPGDSFLRQGPFQTKIVPYALGLNSTVSYQHLGLTRALAADKPNVFWGPGYLLPLLYKGSTLLTVHDIIYEAHPEWYSWPSPWDKLFLRAAGRWSARHANAIVVPSEFTKRELRQYYHIDPERIAVTPLAADRRFHVTHHRRWEFFKKHGINGRYVLFVGAIVNRRAIPTLLEAFSKVSKDFSDLQLVLVGPDYSSPPLHISERCSQLNRQHQERRFIYIPFSDTEMLVQMYNFATLTVALSQYEGFGLPPLEAMACGSPVVVSQKASYPEVVGDAALSIADPLNSSALARVIRRVASDDALQHQLRIAGKKRAALFSWERTANQTLELLLSLCG